MSTSWKWFLLLCVAGCVEQPESAGEAQGRQAAGAGQPHGLPTITERYVTAGDEALNVDSVAVYLDVDGNGWLFATAKVGNVVRIYDAATGDPIRDLGASGEAAGEFRRPNGVVVADGLLVVVERDNRRVQLFGLPSLRPLAVFGRDRLVKPYGAYVQTLGNDRYRLYVTDAYETADEQVPPNEELDRRVQVWLTGSVTHRGVDLGRSGA